MWIDYQTSINWKVEKEAMKVQKIFSKELYIWFWLFLIAASKIYDPLSGVMSNMAELFSVDLQVKRLKKY